MLSRVIHTTFRASNRASPLTLATPPVLLFSKPPRPLQWQGLRFQSEFRRPGGRRRPQSSWGRQYDPNAHRSAKPFLTSEQILRTFRNPQTHVVGAAIAGGGVIFYVIHQEEVPVSGRTRFNCYSDKTVEEHGELLYKHVMAENAGRILPESDRRSRMVNRVMSRLIAASNLENVNWEVHVIKSNEVNAFVIPGGKVFVYSGILPIAQTDDGLATILGHEIAHNIARHAAESMSRTILLEPVRWLFYALDATGYTAGFGRILGDLALDLGLTRPASRMQESEADYIGLMMMSKACYDPTQAPGVWQRMEAANPGGIPAWLSTHPTNMSRIETMQGWLPKAESARAESGCTATVNYARGFQGALGDLGAFGGWGSMR
ncbi:hypothetical protein HYFRA_00004174 [Hymenoscyphus fraxineus]|uniref:Peptidase M48 domain-containing protein n=1 Tax=Hymenoscyphus fraxineus TaxID=746836 RepID=A0A9N9KPS2_9HELO|nr:hypothetical protein HYFRA_00004174 [Hymenoscyphus fraxineus]